MYLLVREEGALRNLNSVDLSMRIIYNLSSEFKPVGFK